MRCQVASSAASQWSAPMEFAMRVFIYYNLHRHILSVRATNGPHRGLVIAHARSVQIRDAHFTVSEAGRQRVLRDRAKNVHAGIVGELIGVDEVVWLKPGLSAPAMGELAPCLPKEDGEGVRRVTYNPYLFATFVDRETSDAVHDAAQVDVFDKDIRCAA